MTEYWLQKKAFNSWSHVTFYVTLEEARSNFIKASAEGNGYSWRMVEVKVIEEKLLNDESPVLPPESDTLTTQVFKTPNPAGEFKSSWGTPTAGWGKNLTSEAPAKAEHGLTGSVWVGNPATKEKKRVPAELGSKLLNEGWIKAGSRTVL